MKWFLFGVFAIANQPFEQIQIQTLCCIHEITRNEMISHMEGEGYSFFNSTLTAINGTCTSLLYFESPQSESHAPTQMPTSVRYFTPEPTPYLSYDLMSI